jgi:hypothetical protein
MNEFIGIPNPKIVVGSEYSIQYPAIFFGENILESFLAVVLEVYQLAGKTYVKVKQKGFFGSMRGTIEFELNEFLSYIKIPIKC